MRRAPHYSMKAGHAAPARDRQGIDPAPVAGVMAVAAVGVGTAMAVTQLRRRSRHDAIVPSAEDTLGE